MSECDCDRDDTPEPLSVTVTKADNGYEVWSDEALQVYEDDGSDQGVCRATASMLYAVLEAVGGLGTKHDDFRVRVQVIERDTGVDILA